MCPWNYVFKVVRFIQSKSYFFEDKFWDLLSKKYKTKHEYESSANSVSFNISVSVALENSFE